ncbi:MAG: O-antigen ligase family protein, partial [Candidatus Latescibacteria bacterium]|nr:O-antigen ligase family protein [Candidatus Latescibacterota bacterium]
MGRDVLSRLRGASSEVVLYGLLGMVVLIPLYFSPSFHDYEIPKMVMLKVFAVLLTLLWVAGMVLRGKITVMDTPLYYTFLAFLAIHFISLFQSYNVFQGLDTLFQYFCCFLLVIVVFHVVQEERQIRCVACAMGATGLIVGAIGLLQYNDIVDLHAPWNIPLSTIGNVNYVAEYYDVVFPIAVVLVFVLRSPWLRAGAIVSCLTMAAHLVVLGSRGGWLGAAVSLSALGAAAALRHFRVGRRVVDVTFTTIVVAGLGWPVLEGLTSGIQIGPERTLGSVAAENWQRMMGRTEDALKLQDDSSQQRVLLWEDTLRLIFERPLVGVGVGNFEYNIPHHMGRETLEVKMRMEERQGRELMAYRAHNEYLEVWAETGILGFGVFCYLLYQILAAIFVQLKRYARGEGNLLSIGFGAAILASLAHSFFSTNLQDPVSASHFWIVVGMVWSLKLKAEGETQVGLMAAESKRGMRILLAGCGLVLALAVALGVQTLLGAYHYHRGHLLFREGQYRATAMEMDRA